jgi:DUF2971 family protein
MTLPPLYKYLDVRGAKLTLGNKTFKQSKPSDFNDAEDMTAVKVFAEDAETVLAKLATGTTDAILKHLAEPPTCTDAAQRETIAILQGVYRDNPKATEVMKEGMKKDAVSIAAVQSVLANSKEFLEEINASLQDYRVFCVTTQKNSERMWVRYAQNHEGIVLRVEPCLEKDSKFKLFRTIEYRDVRPALYNDALEFAESSMFGDQVAKTLRMIDKIIYVKTLEWEYESEYRLPIALRPGEDRNTLAYHPEEITELYLGLGMTDENKKEIICVAKSVNPKIRIYQTGRRASQALIFEML